MNDEEMKELDAWIQNNLFPNGTYLSIRPWSKDDSHSMMVLKKCAFYLEESDNEETVSIGVDAPWMVVEKTNCVPSLRTEAATLELAICLFAKKLFSK